MDNDTKLTLDERVEELEADVGGLMMRIDSILDVLSNFGNLYEDSLDEKYEELEKGDN